MPGRPPPGRALVTGATGFIGSHLVRRLVNEGWETHVVIRHASSQERLRDLAQAGIHVHDGSTGDLVRIVAAAKPLAVFHLASLFLAQHQASDVESLVASNLLFSTQLAEAMAATVYGSWSIREPPGSTTAVPTTTPSIFMLPVRRPSRQSPAITSKSMASG